jgi:sulfate transport system permease protein
VVYLSLLVLIPLAAIASTAFNGGWHGFWTAVRNPIAWAALKFSLENSVVVVAVNTVAGTAVAWVLVRDRFPGKRVLSMIVDLPFALPTVVAGLTLLSLYGPASPFHVNLEGARLGVLVALGFVTLPFSVRSVQPVLEELDLDAEEAAASLGASPLTVLRRIILPSLAPAMLSGAALAFARALGEFGSLVFLANLPGRTESASVYIFGLFSNYDNQGAAAVAFALLVLSLTVLLALGVARRWFLRDGATS